MSKKACVFLSVILTFVITCTLVLGFVFCCTPFGGYTLAKIFMDFSFVEYIDENDLDDAALRGMVDSLDDPYSQYHTEEEYAALLESLESEYEGIGIEVNVNSEDNLVTIVGVFENTPAAKAGILAGDKIIKINDLEVSADTYADMITLIKSGAESSFEITLLRNEETLTVYAEREIIKKETVICEQIDDVYYARVTEFDEKTGEEFGEAIKAAVDAGSKGLVIDLRGNPGGLLTTAVEMADMLLPEADIVYTKGKRENKQYYKSDADYTDIPLVLLVNEYSASASEVLTGALRDNLGTPVVGVKTYGKGCVQSLVPLPGKAGAIRVTTSYYYSPKGICIHGVGFQPDYVVELPEQLKGKPVADIDRAQDTQLDKAIEILQNR